jgi:hypothetical protein
MTREEAQKKYHQIAAMLEGSAEDAHMPYPENSVERIKYEKKMAELVEKFPGIDE